MVKSKAVKVPDVHRRGYILLDSNALCRKCNGTCTQVYTIYKYDDDGFPASEPAIEPCDRCTGTGKEYFKDREK